VPASDGVGGGPWLEIIRELSAVWGGWQSALVPTDGKTIHPLLWRTLETFDADLFFEWPDAEAKHGWLTKDLRDRISKWLAPMDGGHLVHYPPIGHADRAAFPLTATTHAVAAAAKRPTHLVEVQSSDETERLWLAQHFGVLEDGEQSPRKYVEVSPWDCPSAGLGPPMAVALCGAGAVVQRFFGLRDFPVDDVVWGAFQLGMTGLASYGSRAALRRAGRVVAVMGGSAADYCLAYNLSRLLPAAFWVPPEWNADSTQAGALRQALSNLPPNLTERGVTLVSTSLQDVELDALADALRSLGWPNAHRETELPELLHAPRAVYELDNVQFQVPHVFLDGTAAGHLPTPTPQFVRTLHPEVRWMTEVVVEGADVPRRPALLQAAMALPPTHTGGAARPGRTGVAYLCPNVFSGFGYTLKGSIVRPTAKWLTAKAAFDALFGAAGYTMTVSDKGAYAADLVGRCGGLRDCAALLKLDPVATVVDELSGKTWQTIKGTPAQDRPLVQLYDKRYAGKFELFTRPMGTKGANVLIDAWVAAGVITRGLVLKCRVCRACAFYPLGDLTHQFECVRCRQTQDIKSENWGPYDHPPWFYRLAETVHLAVEHNSRVPILALAALDAAHTSSFDWVPEQELRNATGKNEVDLLCLLDGSVCIGEAKLDDRLAPTAHEEEAEVNKYTALAHQVGADVVVFATMQAAWRPATMAIIIARFWGTPFKPLLLNKACLTGDKAALEDALVAMRAFGLAQPPPATPP